MTAYQKEQQFTKIFFKHALKCFYDILQRIQTDKIYNARHILPGWGNEQVVNSTEKNNVIYDVQGRKVKQMNRSGIYIVNGKKFVKK